MNTIIKKRNKSSYKYSNTQKPEIIANSLLSNIYSNNEFNNFQSTVSNITKQLNNMSLGISAKTNNNLISCLNRKYLDTLKKKSKSIFNILTDEKTEFIDYEKDTTIQSNFYSNNIINKEKMCIEKNNSFFISGGGPGGIRSENNITIYNNESELRQENKNLKENIKFLLSQVKKYQKNGVAIEESKNNNNIKENELIIKLKNIINEKENEIQEIKIVYEMEIKAILQQITNLEIQNKNLKNKNNELKNKYNDLKIKNNNKYNDEKDYKRNKLDYYKDEIIKMNNSEIIENNNRNFNFELNPVKQYFRTKKNNNFENAKNIEDNYCTNNYMDKRFIFHKTNYTSDYTNNLMFKKNILINNKKHIKLKSDKCISLNNTYIDEKDNNSYNIIKNDNIPKTTKANNISFLYKKTPVKIDINNIKNINKSIITKSASHNYISSNQKENYQNIKKNYKNEFEKVNILYPKLIKRLSSTLYHKKNNRKLTFQIKDNKKIYNNSYNKNKIKNYNKYNTKEDETKINNNILIPTPSISVSSVRFSNVENQVEAPLPRVDLSPTDLYHFPTNNYISDITNKNNMNNIVYQFNIDNMKFSTIQYTLEKNSTFNLSYSSSTNHMYDILLSITNGFLIITGAKTNSMYYYNKKTNCIYNLCQLNYFHNKGALLQINNDQIMCISGINSIDVEMYYIKDNIWLSLPKMNCSHSESSYMLYNNNIVFSFFGYDYDSNKYINDIEFLIIKNYYSERLWNKINISSINNNLYYNLRNHSIFYRINKENNNSKDIFIVGGYNNYGRNNGLIQIFIETVQKNNYEFKFDINFKKYEENKVKIKGNNNISLDKYNNMDNIFLFSNEFYQYFDEENNLFYSYNYDNNFNIHIIDNFTLKHTIYRNKKKKS